MPAGKNRSERFRVDAPFRTAKCVANLSLPTVQRFTGRNIRREKRMIEFSRRDVLTCIYTITLVANVPNTWRYVYVGRGDHGGGKEGT